MLLRVEHQHSTQGAQSRGGPYPSCLHLQTGINVNSHLIGLWRESNTGMCEHALYTLNS